MESKSDLQNESYDQNRRDMQTNSKAYFPQNYIVQSIAIRAQWIITEGFSKKIHCAIDCSQGAIICH